MFGRKLLFPAVLATAASAPYLVLEDQWSENAKQTLAGVWPGGSDKDGEKATSAASENAVGSPLANWPQFEAGVPAPPPSQTRDPSFYENLAGPTVTNLAELIRFDIRPDWIIARWPRVTPTVGDFGLQGFRVPVASGTRIDDIAGSLTYYFDSHHVVQRVTFEGYTGDERRLVEVVTKIFGLTSEPTPEAARYVARWNGRPTSALLVTRAPVIQAHSPHTQLHARLELNRPGPSFGLSPEFATLLR